MQKPQLRRSAASLTALVLLLLAGFATVVPAQRGGIKRGPWRTKKDYAPGWVVHTSRHYQIQSEAGIDKAKRLAKHMETMLRVYIKCFPPGKKFKKKRSIKLFKTRQGFVAYGRAPGAAAYYSPTHNEMVCYDTGKWMDEESGPKTGNTLDSRRRRYEMDLLGVAAHEGWHQYFHWYVVSWVELPSWINEGMGDYFYAAKPIPVKGRMAMPADLGRLNEARLGTIKAAVKQGRHVPVKELLQYSKRQDYANPSICYAEGWALCQFLQHSGVNKKYKHVVRKFITLVKNDTNMKKVTAKAFRGLDLDKLDKEFQEWVLAQKLSSAKKPKRKKPAGKARGN